MRPEGSERAAFNAISHIRNESFLSLRTDFLNKKEALLTLLMAWDRGGSQKRASAS